MHATLQHRPLGFTRAMRIVAALAAMFQLLLVAAAPLAERTDSIVAAVHVEQAGTSTHHAHGELCAVCAASHLVAPPSRPAAGPVSLRVTARTSADRQSAPSAADRLHTQQRAPPA